jgi:DNA/RNA-binding protein KIN17
MGKEKAGFLTPKAIANRIKAKGLQKLRWYCQMCQKQCRDENGFKCHLMSESHQRQLLLVAENPDKFIDTFSQTFLDDFIDLLHRQYGTKRVHANQVYQEYIHDRHHTHMNSTQWETLTDFVKWLGKEGHCTVDETEKGWFIQYIDRDPETIQRQDSLLKKEKMDMDDEERRARFIQQQIERSRKDGGDDDVPVFTEMQRQSDEEKVTFRLPVAPIAKKAPLVIAGPSSAFSEDSTKSSGARSKKEDSSSGSASRKRKSALEEIREMEESKKLKKSGSSGKVDYWLNTGIVVKILTPKLGEKYYKKKGVVVEVIDKYCGVVKMLDSGDKLRLDQLHLETVIPALGKSVLMLNGEHRGQTAMLESIDEAEFCCSVQLLSGPAKGRILDHIPYEDISKLHSADS